MASPSVLSSLIHHVNFISTFRNNRTSKMVHKSPLNLQNRLLSNLECPVCLEFMKSPILQCSSGHSFCSKCIKQLFLCPVCKISVSIPVRNLCLEKLCEELSQPCKNKQHGCQERVYGKEDPHENRCAFREYSCPISQDMNTDCSWTGALKHILEHVREAHPGKLCNLRGGAKYTYGDTLKYSNVHDISLLHYKGHLFVAHTHYEKCQGKYWKAVQYLGPTENASKFIYEIKLETPDQSRKIIYSRRVHTEDEDIQTLFTTDDCFIYTEKQFQLFRKPLFIKVIYLPKGI